MLAFIRDTIKTGVVTLRVSLLTIFITLFVAAMLTLFSVFYFHLSDMVIRAAYLLVDKDTYAIINDLNIHLYPLEGASKFSAELIENKVLNAEDIEEIQGYTWYLLRKLPLANGVHWSDTNGNFIYSRKENDGSLTTEVITPHSRPGHSLYTYYDTNENLIKQVSKKDQYDPRARPWFKLAFASGKTAWSNVYVYDEHPAHIGITLVTPVYHANKKPHGVFGIDVRLDYLSRYVATQKIGKTGEVFIVDEKGNLIASPQLSSVDPNIYYKDGLITIDEVSKPYAAAFEQYKKEKQSMFIFNNDHVDYIASFKKIPSLLEQGWYLGIVDPENDFTRPIRQLQYLYLMIDSLVFVLGIVLISNLVTRIVTPIRKLVRQTAKIKNFELEHGERIFSRIKEVIDLAEALDAMKVGLRSFQKYVPASLVRQLIKMGEDVRIGGAKRHLAFFFSDIENFTAITEKVESNLLVRQICDYFDALSRIIIDDQGTIDKYIGDSVMAFWGAPAAVQSPCQHAAAAALHCLEKIRVMNQEWQQEGMPALKTRFGIHYGEALVGNIGSSERVNYTALGDVVNTTSRLVSANKLYGTKILVTEVVYEQIKSAYQLRFVDQVVFKGKAESIAIYELIAASSQSILFDLNAYQKAFAEAFAAYQQGLWVEAVKLFNRCIQIYPEDTVARVLIERCQRLQVIAPTFPWDGIWRLSEK